MISENKIHKALLILKNMPQKSSPYSDQLYYGFFDVLLKTHENLNTANMDTY